MLKGIFGHIGQLAHIRPFWHICTKFDTGAKTGSRSEICYRNSYMQKSKMADASILKSVKRWKLVKFERIRSKFDTATENNVLEQIQPSIFSFDWCCGYYWRLFPQRLGNIARRQRVYVPSRHKKFRYISYIIVVIAIFMLQILKFGKGSSMNCRAYAYTTFNQTVQRCISSAGCVEAIFQIKLRMLCIALDRKIIPIWLFILQLTSKRIGWKMFIWDAV